MAKIEDFTRKDHPIVTMIEANYKAEGDKELPRNYLGASIIGHHCKRYLWYAFRHCTREDFPGRLYRLFETGDLEEARMVKDLRAIGCEIHEYNEDGSQFEVSAISGHFGGHLDGAGLKIPTAEKAWHVLEFKTHNRKSFMALEANGVRESKPLHYAQMQVYMHLTGMKRALYVAVNKDTDELYVERVKYDKDYALNLMAKAEEIIYASAPPERSASRSDWYECKFCSAHSLCWGEGDVAVPVPAISCRQCCHATPTDKGLGNWVCEKESRSLTPADQRRACGQHLIIPGLIEFADAEEHHKGEGAAEYVRYKSKDGTEWFNGNAQFIKGCYASHELLAMPASAIGNRTIDKAKQLFGAIAQVPDEEIPF